jgi:DNA replication and repair protein RecF
VKLARLALSDFRNYGQLELDPQPGLNVFIGRNAQGKSNLLEAIAMLGVGKSFRTGRDADVIRQGCERAVVAGDVRAGGDAVRMGCTIVRTARGARKTYARGGRNVPYAKFLGTLPVVTFVPSDLALVTGPPALRRSFVNTALAQSDRDYYRHLARYGAALRQKSALLRASAAADDALLDVYDEVLAASGAAVMIARRAFVRDIDERARAVHAGWTRGAERLEARYAPNVVSGDDDPDELRATIAKRLAAVRPSERLRRMPLAGPHRDDLSLALDERPLSTFGSQGQQRTAVLALKVAEYSVMRDRSGTAPLLLLDDLLSELDEERAAALLAGIGAYEQAFVTATHRPPQLPGQSALFSVEGASVSAAC